MFCAMAACQHVVVTVLMGQPDVASMGAHRTESDLKRRFNFVAWHSNDHGSALVSRREFLVLRCVQALSSAAHSCSTNQTLQDCLAGSEGLHLGCNQPADKSSAGEFCLLLEGRSASLRAALAGSCLYAIPYLLH